MPFVEYLIDGLYWRMLLSTSYLCISARIVKEYRREEPNSINIKLFARKIIDNKVVLVMEQTF